MLLFSVSLLTKKLLLMECLVFYLIYLIQGRREFANTLIDEFLTTFNIQRSFSSSGSPHDNAVIKSPYSIIKTELLSDLKLESIEHLEMELFYYNKLVQ